MKLIVLSGAVVALLISALACSAQSVPAIGRDPAEVPEVFGGGGRLGWTFFVQAPVRVTALGLYDEGRDGLFDAQQISIWRDNSGRTTAPFIAPYTASLVTIIEIPSGTAALLVGSWRVMQLDTALTLQPGGYELAGTVLSTRDPSTFLRGNDPESPRMEPHILLGTPAQGSFLPPDEYPLTYGAYLGPMFFIEVPEPTIPNLILGRSLVFVMRQRRYAAGPHID